MKMKKALKNVNANPFRHIDRYPIQEDKISALKKSIEDTDFWENIVAREVGGKIEIAYGHHRLAALRELYPDTKQFDFIIKDLDDTAMCQIMVNENMEEWGSDAAVEQESIRAIVEGYAEGKVHLSELSADTPKKKTRYAPSFLQGEPSSRGEERPYTSAQLVKFTGWTEWKVLAALAALEKIEQGEIDESAYRGITTKQQQVLTSEVNKVKRNAELEAKKAEKEGDEKAAKEIRRRGKADAKTVAKTLNKGFSQGELGKRDAVDKAREVVAKKPNRPEYPDIIPVTQRLAIKLEELLTEENELGRKVLGILKYKKLLDDKTRASLRLSLRTLADEANELADKLK